MLVGLVRKPLPKTGDPWFTAVPPSTAHGPISKGVGLCHVWVLRTEMFAADEGENATPSRLNSPRAARSLNSFNAAGVMYALPAMSMVESHPFFRHRHMVWRVRPRSAQNFSRAMGTPEPPVSRSTMASRYDPYFEIQVHFGGILYFFLGDRGSRVC